MWLFVLIKLLLMKINTINHNSDIINTKRNQLVLLIKQDEDANQQLYINVKACNRKICIFYHTVLEMYAKVVFVLFLFFN